MLGLFKRKTKKYPLKKDKIYVGAGINLLNDEVGKIYWDRPHNQAIVFGASGCGKSEIISRWTYEAILDDKQFFGIDPKGSKSWLESFFLACHRKGKLYDKEEGPVVLTLPYPEVSVKINPLYGMDPHQIASTIANGIPEGKEPFFKQIAYEIVLTASLGLFAKGEKEIILSDIYKYLKVETLQELEEKVRLETVSNPENAYLVEQALMALSNIAQYDPQYFPRVNSSLRTYLTRLITGNAGAILNVRAGNILWDRLEKGNLKFFAFLNAEAMQQVAYDVGRLLFANLLIYVGKQSQKLKEVNPQLRVIVDEATEVGFSELNKAIRLVRERNVSVSIFTQSPSGFASAFGKDGKGMVIDIVNSCDLRIGLRLASSEDRKFMVDMSPEVSKGQLMLHQNSMNLYYKEDKLLKPFDFETLERGYGYAFLDKTVYYFYSPLTKKYDTQKVKIVFTDDIKKEKTSDKEIIINLKDISKTYPEIKTKEMLNDEKEAEAESKNKEKEKTPDILYIVMKEIKQNYEVDVKSQYKDPDIQNFADEIEGFFKYYQKDLHKILYLFDVFKHSVSSVVGNDKNMLSRISLLNHSLSVAMKTYEKIKTAEDLDQKEKEIAVLSALAHDIGKAFVSKKTYEGKDHERMTKEVLSKLKINNAIIKVASSHHEKPEKLKELGKILKYVSIADQQTRKEETDKIKTVVSKNISEAVDIDKLKRNLKELINTSPNIFLSRDKEYLYIKKEFLYNQINKFKKMDYILTDDDVKKIYPGSEFKRLIGYNKFNKTIVSGIYLVIPFTEKINPAKNKDIEKIKSIELMDI